MIFVTGASGFIGSCLCRRLVAEGNDVVGLSHSGNSFRLNSILNNPHFKLEIGDIRNEEILSLIFKRYKIETVFHLAAQVPYCTGDKDFVGINVDGTLNVASVSIANKVERFIHVSTMSVYSIPPLYIPVDELHPTEPKDIYGKTKLVGEFCFKSNAMNVTTLRLAGAYGEYCDNRAVDIFVRGALANQTIKIDGDGLQSSDFTHVNDIVDGVILAWNHGKETIYNIGSGQETRIKDLADTIIQMTNSKSKVEFVSKRIERPFRFYLNISKAERELGYIPHSLREGLNLYINSISTPK